MSLPPKVIPAKAGIHTPRMRSMGGVQPTTKKASGVAGVKPQNGLTTKSKNTLFATLQKQNPNPTTELQYTNPYQLLIAVVLSAQSTDTGVNKATKNLFAKIKTPQQMLTLGEESLKQHIRTIGLYHTKAKNIIRLSELLIKNHKSKLPKTREGLQSLPGVGRKTANVILNTLYGEPVIAVDTHVFRVSNRTGLAIGKTPEEVEKKLETEVPKKYKPNAHHWLILLGRYTCKATKPNCPQCPIKKQCQHPNKTP